MPAKAGAAAAAAGEGARARVWIAPAEVKTAGLCGVEALTAGYPTVLGGDGGGVGEKINDVWAREEARLQVPRAVFPLRASPVQPLVPPLPPPLRWVCRRRSGGSPRVLSSQRSGWMRSECSASYVRAARRRPPGRRRGRFRCVCGATWRVCSRTTTCGITLGTSSRFSSRRGRQCTSRVEERNRSTHYLPRAESASWFQRSSLLRPHPVFNSFNV